MVDKADYYNNEFHPHWTVDRKIPIGFLFGIFLQTVALVYWGATLENRVTELEKRLVEQKHTNLPQRTTQLEGKLQTLSEILIRVERKLDRIAERK